MKPQDQQIALAEACPFVFVRIAGHSGWNYRNSVVGRVVPCINGDPLQDLNAMHEAEKTMHPLTKREYAQALANVMFRYADGNGNLLMTVFATARQRAEAFLRTIGKWVEI